MRCLCFISPLTKKEALQTATFTPLLAALLNELKPFSIYTWKYTTHKKIRVMVSVQAFLLTVKNCGGGDCVMYWNLHLNEEKAQAPNRWLVLESL